MLSLLLDDIVCNLLVVMRLLLLFSGCGGYIFVFSSSGDVVVFVARLSASH